MGASIKTCGAEILTKEDPDKHCIWGGVGWWVSAKRTTYRYNIMMRTYSEGTTLSHTSFSILLSPKIQIVVNLCTYPADIPTPGPQLGTREGEYGLVWAICMCAIKGMV